MMKQQIQPALVSRHQSLLCIKQSCPSQLGCRPSCRMQGTTGSMGSACIWDATSCHPVEMRQESGHPQQLQTHRKEREREGAGFLSSFKGPTRQESPTLQAQSRCTTHQLPQAPMVPQGRAANTMK